jgi:hypothetical protein
MLVEKFARIEKRISSMQKVNTDLGQQIEAITKRLKVLKTKPAANIPTPRTASTYSEILNSSLPLRPPTNTKLLNTSNQYTKNKRVDNKKNDLKHSKIIKALYP